MNSVETKAIAGAALELLDRIADHTIIGDDGARHAERLRQLLAALEDEYVHLLIETQEWVEDVIRCGDDATAGWELVENYTRGYEWAIQALRRERGDWNRAKARLETQA